MPWCVRLSEGLGGARSRPDWQFVVQLSKARAHLANRNQLPRRTCDSAREELLSLAQGNGGNLNDGFVKEPGVEELASKISAANHPDVLGPCSANHLCMDGTDVTLNRPGF